MSEAEERRVLCGASVYEQKYFFNEKEYGNLPESIKEELHILCVLFTEEVGGVFTLMFEEDGSITMQTEAADEDYLYDEVSAGLMVGEVRRQRREMFEALSLYYRVFILHEKLEDEQKQDGEE
ncbi:MAG: hypothetical protein IJ600_02565 [Lachnospiraceae bacterium]|nr:hypothetical protein [Lachnospiraceae bacterium]